MAQEKELINTLLKWPTTTTTTLGVSKKPEAVVHA